MNTNYWFEEPEKYKMVIAHLDITVEDYFLLIDSIKKVFPAAWVSQGLAKKAHKVIKPRLVKTVKKKYYNMV